MVKVTRMEFVEDGAKLRTIFDWRPRSTANEKIIRFVGAAFRDDPGIGPFIDSIECRRNRLVLVVRLEAGVLEAIVRFCGQGQDANQLRFQFDGATPA